MSGRSLKRRNSASDAVMLRKRHYERPEEYEPVAKRAKPARMHSRLNRERKSNRSPYDDIY